MVKQFCWIKKKSWISTECKYGKPFSQPVKTRKHEQREWIIFSMASQ